MLPANLRIFHLVARSVSIEAEQTPLPVPSQGQFWQSGQAPGGELGRLPYRLSRLIPLQQCGLSRCGKLGLDRGTAWI